MMKKCARQILLSRWEMLVQFLVLVAWSETALQAEIADIIRSHHTTALSAPAQLHSHIECVGQQSGIWGSLQTGLEAWAYPFKLFEEFQVSYSTDGGESYVPESQLAKTQLAEPHLARMIVAEDRFRVEQILFAPRQRPGLAVLFKVDTLRDLEIRIRFRPRLVPMLLKDATQPQHVWDQSSNTLRLHRSDRFASALIVRFPQDTAHHVSSDGAHELHFSIRANSSPTIESVVFAAQVTDDSETASTLDALTNDLASEIQNAQRHFDQLLAKCPTIDSPDKQANQAMLWSVVSLDQLRVKNPDLGYGIVSGYSSSLKSTRPRYAWFFDEPTLASYALLRAGLAGHVQDAFRMLQTYQRADGKTVHEINQSLRFQPDFFKNYKYAYIHTDGPVYFLAAYGHYYRSTGDLELIREHWPQIKKTFAWCGSRLDKADGLITVDRDDWGTVEVGTAIRKDTQLQAMWIAALRETAYLATVMEDQSLAKRCQAIEQKAVDSVASQLWDEKTGFFLWGLSPDGTRLRSLIPHHGIGIWMGSHSHHHARQALKRMAASDFRTDWGVRSLATTDPRYSAEAYQTGTVWPVWNGGVIIGDYMHGRHHSGFRNWRSMTELRSIGGLGPMPEVLHGHFCNRTQEGVPHQLFSEVAIQNGFYDGLLGLKVDVPRDTIELSPALPAHWHELNVARVPVGGDSIDLAIRNLNGSWEMRLGSDKAVELAVKLRPKLPAGSHVKSVRCNGEACEFETRPRNSAVEVVLLAAHREGSTEVSIDYSDGIDFRIVDKPLVVGQLSQRLRLIDASFIDETWHLELEGIANADYTVDFHSDKPPLKIKNGHLSNHKGSVWQITTKAPRDHESTKTGFSGWKLEVSWPRS